MNTGKPIYGMHRGTVGFLMNEFTDTQPQGAARRRRDHRHPSAGDARARTDAAGVQQHYAINEVSLFRQTYQVARLSILVDGQERLAELMGDGVLVATPAGLDRLQSVGAGADHPDRRAAARAHPDQPVPAAALARRAAARHRERHHQGDRSRQSARSPPSPTTTRCATCARSTSGWTTRSRCRCCSIPATAWTSASCASSSATEHGAAQAPRGKAAHPRALRLSLRRRQDRPLRSKARRWSGRCTRNSGFRERCAAPTRW